MYVLFFFFEKNLTSRALLFVLQENVLNWVSFENDSERVSLKHGHFPK